MKQILKSLLIATGATRAYFAYQMRKQKSRLHLEKGVYALSFDLDHERDVKSIPMVLKVLSQYQLPASFACVGKWIEKYPRLHKEIIAEGHEILNHTYSHPDNEELNPNKFFNRLSKGERKKEMAQFHAVCKKLLDYTPVGFRTPHFGRQHTADVYPLLAELGYRYSSSISAYDAPSYGVPFQKQGIWELPVGCSSQHPRCPFDSGSSRASPTPNFKSDKAFLEEFSYILDIVERQKVFITHYFDPWHIVQHDLLEMLCKEIRQREIACLTYRQLLESQIFPQEK